MKWRLEGVLFPVLSVSAIAPSLTAQCPPPSAHALAAYGSASGAAAGPASPAAPTPGGPAPSGPTNPSPATPGPATPSAPSAGAPTGPTTGGPAGPTGSVPSGPRTGGRGAAISFVRGTTSKDRLKLDWQHPVPPAEQSGTAFRGALPLAEALQLLWDDDTRPLVVMRECKFCQGTDQALLSGSAANDRTLLLTKWFRVVRLPPHVLEPDHPFHSVFAGYACQTVPHLYLLSHPTAKPVEFSGLQPQSNLWKGMVAVLEERYAGSPTKAVKEWLSLLDEFDRLDAAVLETQQQLDEARAKHGPDSDRARNLQKRVAEARKEHTDALAREERVRDLGLTPMPKAPAATTASPVKVSAGN
jgi:hypothetical protein